MLPTAPCGPASLRGKNRKTRVFIFVFSENSKWTYFCCNCVSENFLEESYHLQPVQNHCRWFESSQSIQKFKNLLLYCYVICQIQINLTYLICLDVNRRPVCKLSPILHEYKSRKVPRQKFSSYLIESQFGGPFYNDVIYSKTF